MAKAIKLKVAKSELPTFFRENTLVKGKVMEDGSIHARDIYGVWFPLRDNLTIVGNDHEGKECIVEFVKLKTKTILCTWVDHKNPVKKSFKMGKRYQIEQGRVLGGVAGYVFDEDGDRWTLYREEVGFSAAGVYLFEAKYS